MITLEKIRDFATRLPGLEEGVSYRTPGWKVGKKLVVRLHQKEDAIVVVVSSVDEQQVLIAKDSVTFYIIDHHESHPMVLVRPIMEDEEFFVLIEQAWQLAGGKFD